MAHNQEGQSPQSKARDNIQNILEKRTGEGNTRTFLGRASLSVVVLPVGKKAEKKSFTDRWGARTFQGGPEKGLVSHGVDSGGDRVGGEKMSADEENRLSKGSATGTGHFESAGTMGIK